MQVSTPTQLRPRRRPLCNAREKPMAYFLGGDFKFLLRAAKVVTRSRPHGARAANGLRTAFVFCADSCGRVWKDVFDCRGTRFTCRCLAFEGGMASPRHFLELIAALAIISGCMAGPLGPLPNVTSLDLGLKEGGCSLGDVVYMPGDEFPGESACERCTCTGGGVQCAKQRCEPRPGCKALHRPDHCCPTYQCECEQEGRVYGNGEKLVDPADPCRVCYCQGGEVVCRRIACFVRDDCTPRHVPGRCCPEYDNCPLRGVTSIPGIAPAVPNISTFEHINSSVIPSSVKQEITIKEITPVSEIPVITEVKIKEILPSPSIEVAEYSSSKSPLIPREVTSEKSQINTSDSKFESSQINHDQSPSADSSLSTEASKIASEKDSLLKTANDPSKISLSTQDSINSNIYTSSIPIAVATVGSPSAIPSIVSVPSSKAPMIEEEDTSLFDHNPAFPPLPDDLSVLGNHEEEILTEQNMEGEHIPSGHEVVIIASTNAPTEVAVTKEAGTTTSYYVSEATSQSLDNLHEVSSEASTIKADDVIITVTSNSRENSMVNLRSVMPTEIINVPSHLPEITSVELSDATEAPIFTSSTITPSFSSDESGIISKSRFVDDISLSTDIPDSTEFDIGNNITESSDQLINAQVSEEQTTSSISKSNMGTEVTSQTELSSLPIETSDQNPHDSSENITKDKSSESTVELLSVDEGTTKLWPTNSELSVSKTVDENQSFENIETTEFVLSPLSSQEITTSGVELIKKSADIGKNSAIIDQSSGKNNNVLKDLINLVGDVASIGDHTDGSDIEHHTASPTTISDSEELIPVNAGYKSKNKNWNLNSITEVPFKTKASSRHKNVEIEDDDTDSITDSPPPNDKVEPTTRRPIIDNVSDDRTENKTEKKDIEIITKSYVPTINRRPTKVVMGKSNEKAVTDEAVSDEGTTDGESDVSDIATAKYQNPAPTTVGTQLDVATTEDGASSAEKITPVPSLVQ
ncbi:unnamed protein product, partial [Iphiclides podalirius]